MRTTLNLQDDLIKLARKMTGVHEKTKLIHMGLQSLVQKAAANRLAQLGGTFKGAKAAPRKRRFS